MAKDEEELLTLPVGHPQAGYISPDLSLQDHVGLLPPEEQEAYDEQVAARQEEVDAVAQHEHEVATAEREEALGPAEAEVTPRAKRSSAPAESTDS